MTQLIDGIAVSRDLLSELTHSIGELVRRSGKHPGLAVILVGNNPASQAYVNRKKKACEQVGIQSFDYTLPEDVSQAELEGLISELNQNPSVHGILLQLPLPPHIHEDQLLQQISPEKDVDGFHPTNMGKLLQGQPTLRSCTPYGVCQLLKAYNLSTSGKHVVIVGRSNIVGKPLAALLLQRGPFADATVTVCHSKTAHLADIVKQGDIVIAAIGSPHFITADMIKPGAIVIDVGINRVSADNEKGYALVGDVNFDTVKEKASAITPVPGGVGPMTIAMLMSNTVQAFKEKEKIHAEHCHTNCTR